MDPEPRSVHRRPERRERGQDEKADRRQPEEVLVALEPAVVAAEDEQHGCEEHDRDHDPEALAEGVVGVQAVDLGQAERSQEPRDREQVRVGVRHGQARDEVRGAVEDEEEPGVGERCRRDDVLPGDVDAGEADAGEDADGDEEEELPVARLHWGRRGS